MKSYREKAKIIAEILYHGPTEKKTTWKWPFVQNVISTVVLYPYRFCHAGSERAIGEIERQVLKRTATLVVLSTFTRNKASKMEEIVIISSIST